MNKIQKLGNAIKHLWDYVRELEDYKWERGSSCCMPTPDSLHDNPFHFEEKPHLHHHSAKSD